MAEGGSSGPASLMGQPPRCLYQAAALHFCLACPFQLHYSQQGPTALHMARFVRPGLGLEAAALGVPRARPWGSPAGREGCWEGCSGFQPGEPAFLCQPTLRTFPQVQSKQNWKSKRSVVCVWPPAHVCPDCRRRALQTAVPGHGRGGHLLLLCGLPAAARRRLL